MPCKQNSQPGALADAPRLQGALHSRKEQRAHPLCAKLKLLRTLTSVSGQMLLLRLFLAAACPTADTLWSCAAIKGCMRKPITACRSGHDILTHVHHERCLTPLSCPLVHVICISCLENDSGSQLWTSQNVICSQVCAQ